MISHSFLVGNSFIYIFISKSRIVSPCIDNEKLILLSGMPASVYFVPLVDGVH
jgi:hypothetical protein